MVAHTLRLDNAQLQGLGMDEATKLVTRVVRRTLNRSAVLCPVDTGNLRATGSMSVGSRGAVVVGEVVYSANYAAAVHEGRRALTIRARRPGGKLKFTVGGRTVYATQVHQPARAGRPFLASALREVATQEGFRVTIG
jgi:hypothetical protein